MQVFNKFRNIVMDHQPSKISEEKQKIIYNILFSKSPVYHRNSIGQTFFFGRKINFTVNNLK